MINKLQKDKLLHFICGTYIMLVSQMIVSQQMAVLTVVIIALAKELIYDKLMKRGTPEVMDIIFTVVGGLLALILTQ